MPQSVPRLFIFNDGARLHQDIRYSMSNGLMLTTLVYGLVPSLGSAQQGNDTGGVADKCPSQKCSIVYDTNSKICTQTLSNRIHALVSFDGRKCLALGAQLGSTPHANARTCMLKGFQPKDLVLGSMLCTNMNQSSFGGR